MPKQLIVNRRNKQYFITGDDLIMYNGTIFQLVTQKEWQGWHATSPVLPKGYCKQLIKHGCLAVVKEEIMLGMKVIYYKLTDLGGLPNG